jgi:DNA-binding cell septation regulator SpoVG
VVKVIEVRLQANGKPLKAFVDVNLDGMIIRDFRVIKEEGKRLWIASPQISWRNKEGIIMYKTLTTFSDEIKGQIDFAVLTAYQREVEKSNGRHCN